MNRFKNIDVLVVALAKDCGNLIKSEICHLSRSIDLFGSKSWLVIESDSDDNTVEVLKECQRENDNFRFISLGKLSNKFPKRTERIAYCRNKYLYEINYNPLYKNIDYIIVADIDGMNNLLTLESLKSCWDNNNWDVCTANQDGPYYDIWALRHKDWCPGDCWNEFNFLLNSGLSYQKSLFAAVHSKMINIPQCRDWIEVESAFGGLAIYRKKYLENIEYIGLRKDGREVCEHVSLHKKIRSRGGSIFINPKLINTGLTEHTQHNNFYQKLKVALISIVKKYSRK